MSDKLSLHLFPVIITQTQMYPKNDTYQILDTYHFFDLESNIGRQGG